MKMRTTIVKSVSNYVCTLPGVFFEIPPMDLNKVWLFLKQNHVYSNSMYTKLKSTIIINHSYYEV